MIVHGEKTILNHFIEVFVNLDDEKVKSVAQRCLAAGIIKYDVIAALNEGLMIIGKKYENDEYTLTDLMMAGILFQDIINMKEFDIAFDVNSYVQEGTIILGTVKTDIHDIGKSMFKSVALASGFKIVDLGVDVSPETFCKAVKSGEKCILALSAVLTTTIQYLRETVDELIKHDLRKNVKIIIGGSLVSEEICRYIGADAFSINALDGVNICKTWVNVNE